MNLDLDALERAAAAATPGPWVRVAGYRVECHEMLDVTDHGHYATWSGGTKVVRVADMSNGYQPERDAEFIALSNPAVITEMVRRLRAAEADVDKSSRNAERLGRAIDHAGMVGGMKVTSPAFTVNGMIDLVERMGLRLKQIGRQDPAPVTPPQPLTGIVLAIDADAKLISYSTSKDGSRAALFMRNGVVGMLWSAGPGVGLKPGQYRNGLMFVGFSEIELTDDMADDAFNRLLDQSPGAAQGGNHG